MPSWKIVASDLGALVVAFRPVALQFGNECALIEEAKILQVQFVNFQIYNLISNFMQISFNLISMLIFFLKYAITCWRDDT